MEGTKISALSLKGSLVNNSGYKLTDVEIIVHTALSSTQWGEFVRGAGDQLYVQGGGLGERGDAGFDDGEAGDGGEDVESAATGGCAGGAGRRDAGNGVMGGMGGEAGHAEDADLLAGHSSYLLSLLLDARKLEFLTDRDRVEPVRVMGRAMDCTKMLYAAGGLIVARAGNIDGKDYVKSPVPLTVNGRQIAGQGRCCLHGRLPVEGKLETGG